MDSNSPADENSAPQRLSETAPLSPANQADEVQETSENGRPSSTRLDASPVADQEDGPSGDTPPEFAGDPLAELANRAAAGRLSSADEDRAAALLKAALLEGRPGVERAVEQLPKLPWIVGVNGVTAAWPELKTTYRARLIGGLAKIQTDAARRVRLSLSRGLFKHDVPAAVKLAVGVAKEVRDKETGAVTPKNSQIFANVLIGRAKPWIAQVSLADVKPADGDLLVHCAVLAVFGLPHAPATQLGILKWAAGADRLGKLHPAALESVKKALGRWNAKWQGALRKEVAELPEEIASALGTPAAPAKQEERRRAERPDSRDEDEGEDREQSASEHGAAAGALEAEDSDARDEDDEEDEDSEAAPPPQPKPRPVYESKTVPSQPQRRSHAPANFNLSEALKQIEAHVSGLRSELQATQNKLRQQQRDEDRKPRRGAPDRSSGIIVPGEPTPDELARLNRQLETRITEQQVKIEELLADSEDRAASMDLPEAAASPDAQLRALLSLKLQEDFEDFAALESEAPDIVVQQHYRTVLRHVFEVLRNEGVRLSEPQRQ